MLAVFCPAVSARWVCLMGMHQLHVLLLVLLKGLCGLADVPKHLFVLDARLQPLNLWTAGDAEKLCQMCTVCIKAWPAGQQEREP